MERIECLSEVDDITLIDHLFRYKWASSTVCGTVLDAACGIGYGSEILLKNTEVKKYIGVDKSAEAIQKASGRYGNEKCSFVEGNIYNLAFIADQSIDAVVSLETFEHLDQPEQAAREFRRILKPNGLLVGSVPTSSYDDFHKEFHGGNAFHLSRFTQEALERLIGSLFPFFQIYLVRIRLGVEAKLMKSTFGVNSETKDVCLHDADGEEELGVFLFAAASTTEALEKLSRTVSCPRFIELHSTTSDIYRRYVSLYKNYLTTSDLYQQLQDIYRKETTSFEKRYSQLYDNYLETTKLYRHLEEQYQQKENEIFKLLNRKK